MSLTDLVDPFHGVDGPGNCLPGPYLPLSLVRLGPDIVYPQPTNGYRTSAPIARFSHTHVSGTGGGGRYGNIGVTPFTGAARLGVDPMQRQAEEASPGYYRLLAAPSGIECELTSTPRVGVHRYTFPEDGPNNLLIDAGCAIQRRGEGLGANTAISIGGFLEWIGDTELIGRGDYQGGWGHSFPYSVYFYARFEAAPKRRLAADTRGILDSTHASGPHSRAIAQFEGVRQVVLRVGISHVSVAKARASVDREAAASFDAIREAARQTWEKALGRIRVDGGSDRHRRLFYSLFTRLICMPSDLGVDDEFGQWHSGVRHFTDYYALWDSVRNANSLIGLFDPALEVDMLNCLLDVGDHIGWVPDAWIAGHSAQIQGGSSADILLCEAKLKGLEGIDYARALRQMRKNAEVRSPDPWLYGRYGDYHDLDFMSSRTTNGVSRHLEYAYQDWCIGRLAEELGEAAIADDYYRRADRLWNLWRDDIRFFAPKTPDGQWVNPFDPLKTVRPDSWKDPYFYEGPSKCWSFNTQADFAGLIARHGGPDGFAAHLDWFFDGGHYHTKETWLHVPYLYHYVGRPEDSMRRARWAMDEFFTPGPKGLRDNEDMGCQSAYFMGTAMGIYPMMGQDVYLLIPPVFEAVEVELGSPDRLLRIEKRGDGEHIAGLALNGKPLNRAWIRHGEIAGGATLTWTMGDAPADLAEAPPSPLHDWRKTR